MGMHDRSGRGLQGAAPAQATGDEDLLRAFAAGHREALGELAARHEQALLGLARGLLGGSTALASEAVQDAWVRVIRHAATYDGRASVRTWLYRIVINRCRDLHARERRRDTVTRAVTLVTGGSGPRPARSPDEGDAEALLPALALLDADKREVVVLVYGRGLTHEAAADVLAIPVGTLKSRLHAALRHLRQHMKGRERHGNGE